MKVRCGTCGKEKQDCLKLMVATSYLGKRICRTCWNKRFSIPASSPVSEKHGQWLQDHPEAPQPLENPYKIK